MERDRSLLSLSAAGIGLLITLLTAVGVGSILELGAYLSAFLCFGVVIILVLKVLGVNKNYLIELTRSKEPDEKTLKRFDRWIYFFFVLALTLSFVVGVFAAVSRLTRKEVNKMSEKKIPSRFIGSFAGLTNLRPDVGFVEKSFQGLAQLRPVTQSQTTSTTESSSTTTSNAESSDAATNNNE